MARSSQPRADGALRSPGVALTFDISPTVIGFAAGDLSGDVPTYFGHWKMPDFGGEGATYRACTNEIYGAIKRFSPTKLVIEKPLAPRAIVERTTTENVYRIWSMRGLVYEAGDRLSIPVSGFGADDIRMDLLGRCRWPGGSKEAKRQVVAFVRRLGLDVTDHNAADAINVWLYVQRRSRGISGATGQFRDAAD